MGLPDRWLKSFKIGLAADRRMTDRHPPSQVVVAYTALCYASRGQQETQLSLTNLRDAFIGQ